MVTRRPVREDCFKFDLDRVWKVVPYFTLETTDGLHLPVSADFIGGGLVSLWWLCYVVLLDKSPFKRSPGVFRAQDWGPAQSICKPN